MQLPEPNSVSALHPRSIARLMEVVQGPAKEYLQAMGWRYPDEAADSEGLFL